MCYPKMPLYKWNEKVILVVEDDLYSFHLLYEMLKHTSCSIIHSMDGVSAFVNCIRSPRIDIVLLDIKIPRLDGIDTLHLIKKHRPAIPVFAQTAYAMVNEKERFMKFGCDEYFSKPFSIDLMMRTINVYLNKSCKGELSAGVQMN